MRVKTSELSGAALDWAVAKCEELDEAEYVEIDNIYGPQWRGPEYSTDWAWGGPIIERERIDVYGFDGESWGAEDNFRARQYGDTPLIAAMRCFVASKLGDEVDVPDELVAREV